MTLRLTSEKFRDAAARALYIALGLLLTRWVTGCF